jgi:CubicO group peptidase (beta-lactamase class C family)
MKATSLGLGGRPLESTAQAQHHRETGNLFYRSALASPWGGVYSTAADLTRFLQYFMNPGHSPLKIDTVQDMTRNHCPGLDQPWGIGWMLATSHDVYYQVHPKWSRYGLMAYVSDPEHGPAFGSSCSPSTFGHYGVSGTIAWADPIRRLSMVLLTTRFARYSRDGVLGPVSDLISKL